MGGTDHKIRIYKIKATRSLSSPIITSTITFIIAISIFYWIDHYSNESFVTSITTASANPIPDQNGVIMYNYPDVEGNVYNPLILASWGLEYYTKYENTRDTKFKNYFINTANVVVFNLILNYYYYFYIFSIQYS